MECIIPNAGDTIADRYADQAGATTKRTNSDCGDTIGNYNACQAGIIRKGNAADADNGYAADRAWNDNSAAGACVAGDESGCGIKRKVRLW